MKNFPLQLTANKNLQTFLAKEDYSNKDLLKALHNSTEVFKYSTFGVEEKNIVQKSLLKILDEVAIRFDLYSTKGFLNCYYETLPEYSTGKEAFDFLNNDFEEMTGEKRYKDFDAFKEAIGLS